MEISKKDFGKTAEGRAVEIYELKNSAGTTDENYYLRCASAKLEI